MEGQVRASVGVASRGSVSAPRYVIRDRDSVYGALVRARIKAMGIEEVVTAPRSPWQNPSLKG